MSGYNWRGQPFNDAAAQAERAARELAQDNPRDFVQCRMCGATEGDTGDRDGLCSDCSRQWNLGKLADRAIDWCFGTAWDAVFKPSDEEP